MQTLGAAKFKSQMLALLDKIAQSKEPIIVTKHGNPIVKVIPIEEKEKAFDKPLKGTATFIGDIISPIDDEWEAEN